MTDLKNDSSGDESQELPRTVCFTDVTEDLREPLLVRIESKRVGGGKVKNNTYDSASQRMVVIFEDQKVADHFIQEALLTVKNVTVKMQRADGPNVLYVHGLTKEAEEMAEDYLTNDRYGGGDFVKYKYDEDTNSARIEFANQEVAKKLYEKQTMEIDGCKVSFSRFPPAKSSVKPNVNTENSRRDSNMSNNESYSKDDEDDDVDDINAGDDEDYDNNLDDMDNDRIKRSILIKDVPKQMHVVVEPFLESKKNGGGNLEDYQKIKEGALATFADETVAARFIQARYVEIKGLGKYVVLPANLNLLMQTQHDSSISDFHSDSATDDNDNDNDDDDDDLQSRMVEIVGLPNKADKDELMLFLENKKRSGGGEVSDLKLNLKKGMATVTFADPSVVDAVLSKGELKYIGGSVLKVRKVSGENNNDDDAKMDDSHLYKVQLSGLPRDIDKDTLSMFLENRRKSGGGPLQDTDFNITNGRTVVAFQDKEVAAEFLKKGQVKYLDNTMITIDKVVPENSESSLRNERQNPEDDSHLYKVQLSGFSGDIEEESLTMFLENKRKSGGGSVRNIDISGGTVIATFDNKEDAASVLSKETLSYLSGATLRVSPVRARKPSTEPKREHSGSSRSEAGKESCTVLVSGVEKLDEEQLRLYFENKKRSEGGNIRNYNRISRETALIVFESSADAVNVARKRIHEFSGARMTAEMLESWPDFPPLAVKVTGFSSKSSKEMIDLYFESTRTSGGAFENLLYDEEMKTAVIIYPSADIIQKFKKEEENSILKPMTDEDGSHPDMTSRVASNRNLTLDGTPLRAELLYPAPPPPLVMGQDIDPLLLLFTRIFPLGGKPIDRKLLRLFVESSARTRLNKISYLPKPGDVLVQYISEPDYENVRAVVCCKPFQGVMISVQRVPRPSAIQVHNISGLDEEMLRLYFESEKASDRSEIDECKIMENKNCAVIKFSDNNAIQKILSRQHTLSKKTLAVEPFIDCIGILPSGFDTSVPFQPLPSDVTVQCESEIMNFIVRNAEAKRKLEEKMTANYCHIKWPEKFGDPLLLCCTLKAGSSEAFQLSKDWSQKCTKMAELELSQYAFLKVDVLQHIWNQVSDAIKSLKWPPKSILIHAVDGNNSQIYLCGFKKEVENMMQQIHEIKSVEEEKLKRAKMSVKQQVKLSKEKCYLVNKFFQDTFTEDVKVTENEDGFELFGLAEKVIALKSNILQGTLNFFEGYVNQSTKAKCSFLVNREVEERLVKKIDKSSLKATFKVAKDNNDIKVFAVNKDDGEATIDLINSEIKQSDIKLQENAAACLKSRDWKDFKKELKTQFGLFELSEETNQLIVVAFKDEHGDLVKRVTEFVGNNAIKEKFIPLEEGLVELIKKYDSEDFLYDLRKKYSEGKIEITWTTKPKPGCSIRGLAAALQSVTDEVTKKVETVKTRNYNVDQSMVRVVKGNMATLTGYADRYKVIVKQLSDKADVPVGSQVIKSWKYLKENGGIIKLVVGDITRHPVDCIVNAANSNLDHIGGVAKAIVDVGGREIQEECTRYVNTKGKVAPGKIFCSMPGKLPCKKVIHTVGPIWHGGTRGEERQLNEAVLAALQASAGAKSLSLPFISCGIYKFPKDKGAEIILKSIRDYFGARHAESASEVHIVLRSKTDVNIFSSMISDIFSDKELTVIKDNADGESEDEGYEVIRQEELEEEEESEGAVGGAVGGADEAGRENQIRKSASSFTTMEGLTVTIKKGIIADEKVDAIVNTLGRDLNLSNGAISKSLLDAAGQELQDHLTANYPNGLRGGQIGHTDAFKLKCKKVFHATCMRWDGNGGNSEKFLRRIVFESLLLASKEKMKSIAFPTIGCGKLRYPPEKVAEVIFGEVQRFSATERSNTVTDVIIVVFYKDTDNIFERFQSVLGNMKGDGSGMAQSNAYESSGEGRRPARNRQGGHSDTFETKLNGVTFKVKKGNIVHEKSDAVVNSTNQQLNLSHGALSKAIAAAAGPEFSKECTNLGGLKNGMAKSGAGKLQCKCVYHLWARDPRGWKDVVIRCLQDADNASLTSISLPPLGTGRKDSSVADQAKALYEAVKSFSESKPQNLKYIAIVIRDEMISEFIAALGGGGHGRGAGHGPAAAPRKKYEGQLKAPSLVLQLYAFDEGDIDSVLREMSKLNGEKVINLKNLDVKKLTEEHKSKLRDMERRCGLKIEILPGEREIKITGDKNEISEAVTNIYALFHEEISKENENQRKKLLEVVGKSVSWEFEESEGKFKPFDAQTRGILEEAYKHRRSSVEITPGRTKYRVDLKTMEEEMVRDPSKKFKVRRSKLNDVALPSRWEKMAADKAYLLVKVAQGSEEFQKVASGLPSIQANIVQIERIQNPTLYRQYMSRKKDMDRVNGTQQSNERRLWHGTSPDNTNKINLSNFNRSYCGQHGVAIGNGVYFATNPDYSIRGYCRPDANGLKKIYQARVLTGKFAAGANGMKEPPPLQGTERLYDSVVDNVTSPGMFVVFYDPQTYPEYLVTFK